MKLAVFADVHLTALRNTSQLAMLRCVVRRIREEKPDAAVFLGDATACGEIGAARLFRDETADLPCPKLFVAGNADLRMGDGEVPQLIREGCCLRVGPWRLIGLDTSAGRLREEDRALLAADSLGRTIAFLHHAPFQACEKRDRERLAQCAAVVYGHRHFDRREGNEIAVRALDPDKAIGGPPALTWLEAGEEGISVTVEPCMDFAPEDITRCAGISCYDTDAILWAAANSVPTIEIRPGSVNWDRPALLSALALWRQNGGQYLSLHMPDYGDGCDPAEMDRAVAFAGGIGVDGATFHVPRVSVERYEVVRDAFADSVAGWIRGLPESCAVGIENMHMTKSEKPDGKRRFGYIPPECVAFCGEVNARFGTERTGFVLDVGHARNNAPYSTYYPIGDWYATVGSRARAYHVHQVIHGADGHKNHNPITTVYGPLISYCGFSYCWNHGILARKPVFLEIRGDYRTAYETFTGRKTSERSLP